MSAATASVADVRLENKEDSRTRSDSGRAQAQCTPRPLPAVGTQRIIQGNGTNVGTVISLQCPAKHKLVGKDLTCIMGTNSTRWVGETFCQPLSPYEDYGFRVAVLASIISTGIILLMSVAFITCCLLDCIEEDENKRNGREPDGHRWEGQDQRQRDSGSHYGHKGRNNNNNNAEDKMLPWRETANPALMDNIRPCRYTRFSNYNKVKSTLICLAASKKHKYLLVHRCQQQYTHSTPLPPLAALPGQDYDQPLLAQKLSTCPPEYPGPPLSSCQAANSGPVHFSAVGPGLVWQYGGQRCDISEVNPAITRNINTNGNINPKEVSIRIISV
uniref:Sushi domain containing 3 n=1 Tax=Fundulus heteroclitus TaxID=8078 RepID=A0A146Z382_FUNHE